MNRFHNIWIISMRDRPEIILIPWYVFSEWLECLEKWQSHYIKIEKKTLFMAVWYMMIRSHEKIVLKCCSIMNIFSLLFLSFFHFKSLLSYWDYLEFRERCNSMIYSTFWTRTGGLGVNVFTVKWYREFIEMETILHHSRMNNKDITFFRRRAFNFYSLIIINNLFCWSF